MSDLIPGPGPGAAIGLDHIGIVAADLDALAREFEDLGFHLTPYATHASGRTANRCVMLREGGYLELMATVPGHSSATLDRFLGGGPGAHILALEVSDELAVPARLGRAGIKAENAITERDAGPDGARARFALVMPPDLPEGRVLLIRHLTRALLWRPEYVVHRNRAVALTEAVYATDAPAETLTRLSRLAGRPGEPDSLGGYRIRLGSGCVRILTPEAAAALFPGATRPAGLIGLTIAAQIQKDEIVHAGGVAMRFTATHC